MKRNLRFLFGMKGRTGLLAFVFSSLFSLLLSSNAWAQSREVSGKVTSSDDKAAMPGVSVVVKGTANGTITDADGKFTLSVENNSTLEISSIGYATQEIVVGTQSVIDVVLAVDAKSLSEIVVVGYGSQKRRDVTGAISSVNAEQIAKLPVSDLNQSLQGRAAGVQILNNDASPGGNTSVLIRGIGSLSPTGNAPLYIVDGYPTTDGINNINPNDIATMDVLKDASATSIYGVRAANGVIIVTTKKGVAGKTQVTFDAYTMFVSKPKLYNTLGAKDWATLSNYVEANDLTNTYKGLPIWHTPDQLHSVDWQNAMYRKGITQNYSLGIRGGSDKVQTAVTVGYNDQKGVVLGSYFKRLAVGINLDYQATKWLKSSTSVKYTYQNQANPFGTGSLFQLTINPPTLDDGNPATYQIKENGNYGYYNPLQSNVYKFGNPVYTVETNQYENKNNYVLATSSLEATIIPGLKVKTNGGVNFTANSNSFYQPEDDRARATYPTAIAPPANYSQSLNQKFEWLWENFLSYDKTFGDHTLSLLGGLSAQQTTFTSMSANGIPPNGGVDGIRDLAQSTNVKFAAGGNGRSISALASEFARLNYNYGDRYMITGTIRRDGSSKFAPGHQYGTFPSVAVGWRMKNERFLKDVNFFDDLKLRASYGSVGNQSAINQFAWQAQYVGNFPANYNGGGNDNLGYPFNKAYQVGYAQNQPANPNLRWETDVTTDVGFDAAFLQGHFTVTADWYRRESKDFLLNIQSPTQSGYAYINRNVGHMSNEGFEVALGYKNDNNAPFHFGANLTLTHNTNKLIDLASGTDYILNPTTGPGIPTPPGQGWDQYSRTYVGGSVGEFYGYQSLGIIQTQAQIDALNAAAPGGTYYRAATSPGDRLFKDTNGADANGITTGKPDGKVDANDRVSLGSPQPKFYGGLNLDGRYKAWDINLFFYGSYGNKIMNYVESNLQTFQKRGSEGVENVSVEYYNNYWRPDRPSNTFGRAQFNDDNTLNNVPSSAWVQNGSFLKLKTVTVGYTLPKALLDKVALTRLRVYLSTQNLFWITSYKGSDPEVGIQGGNANVNGLDVGNYPSSKSVTVGVNLTF